MGNSGFINKPEYCKNKQPCCKKVSNPICKVTSQVNDELIFVESNNDIICHYKMSFGYSYLCNCPRRKELLKQKRY